MRRINHGLAALASLFAGLGASGYKPVRYPRNASGVCPYTDRAGMPHGRSGDKLARKAMSGTVGIRSGTRGPLASMLIVRKAKFPFSSTKR